jgi:hypothetical protein
VWEAFPLGIDALENFSQLKLLIEKIEYQKPLKLFWLTQGSAFSEQVHEKPSSSFFVADAGHFGFVCGLGGLVRD